MPLIDEGIESGTYFDIDITKLRAKKHEAQLCFMSMNIIDPPDGAFWGKFNDRVLVKGWVSTLVKLFEHVDNCADDTSMSVAVKREWIEGLADKDESGQYVDKLGYIKNFQSVEGKTITEIPEIRFTAKGLKEIEPRNLWVLGGNHRREAMKIVVEGLKQELANKKSHHEKLKAAIPIEDQLGPKGDEIDAAAAEIREIERKISNNSKWAVRLFDRGARSIEPADAIETN